MALALAIYLVFTVLAVIVAFWIGAVLRNRRTGGLAAAVVAAALIALYLALQLWIWPQLEGLG